jgi:hypothetical protein
MLDQVLNSILEEKHVLGGMFILLVLAVIALFRINSTCNKDLLTQREGFEKKLGELYDARMVLLERVLTALEQYSKALDAQNTLVAARIVTAEATTTAISKVGSVQEIAVVRFGDQLNRIEMMCLQFNRIVNPPSVAS